MTTTQTPVDALMALVIEYRHAPTKEAVNIRAAIEASARALAAIPEPTAPAQDAQGVIKPWEERVKPDFPNTDPRSWKPGISLGGVESHMKEEIDELRAALRASSPAEPTINLKGHEFKPSDLLRRAVLNLRKGRSEFFWAVVSKSFGLGSTCSAALAAWAGRDPDTGIVTKEST